VVDVTVVSPREEIVYTLPPENETAVRAIALVVCPARRVLRSYTPGGTTVNVPADLYATLPPTATSVGGRGALCVQCHGTRIGYRVHKPHERDRIVDFLRELENVLHEVGGTKGRRPCRSAGVPLEVPLVTLKRARNECAKAFS
jgi:hypothetical protein